MDIVRQLHRKCTHMESGRIFSYQLSEANGYIVRIESFSPHLYKGAQRSGAGCSNLTTSLVNISLKFQTLISEICQYFLFKNCEKFLQCKSFSHFFNKKNSVYLVIEPCCCCPLLSGQ